MMTLTFSIRLVHVCAQELDQLSIIQVPLYLQQQKYSNLLKNLKLAKKFKQENASREEKKKLFNLRKP